MTAKKSIRDQIRKKREALPAELSHQLGERLLPYLKNFLKAESWLLFAPIRNEISTRPIFDLLIAHNRICFFPKIEAEQIEFYQIKKWNELQLQNGIPEPYEKSLKYSNKCGVALIPAVAFSSNGHRLGYGKGHYDRFLAQNRDLMRVGIAYDFQVTLSPWDHEPHDEPMDYVVTPGGVWTTKRFL